MNHFSLNLPPTDTLWYTPMETHHQQQQQQHKSFPLFYSQQQQQQHHHFHSLSSTHPDDVDSDNSSSNFPNDNRSETSSTQSHHQQQQQQQQHSVSIDHREHMFEKPLTPSDVGKLNRLVIPKQHAEKYFPLAGVSTPASVSVSVPETPTGTSGGGGGVLLGFEDETGKCWRFRYSYWNSSQSYVLTKGWSRYVKEKKLDAGDVVLFERHRFDSDRFFIGWRRRASATTVQNAVRPVEDFGRWTGQGGAQSQRYNVRGQVQVQAQQLQGYPVPQGIAASFPYQTECFHAAGTDMRQQQRNQKAGRSSGVGNSKRLRLFGVNLECQLEDDDDAEPQTSDGSSLSSQGPVIGSGSGSGLGPVAYNYFDYMGYPQNHHDHMEMNYPQDVNQMRNNRLG